MSIGKKKRFDIFKRDQFTCVYCGNKPPSIVLEVDHVIPKSKGGKDEIDNLVTSCFDCNRGKRDHLLEVVPQLIKEKQEILQQQQEQLKEYEKHLRKQQRDMKKKCRSVVKIYEDFFKEYTLSEVFIRNSINHFVKKLPITEIEDAMYIACNKIADSDKSIKYFCGICHMKIRNNQRCLNG